MSSGSRNGQSALRLVLATANPDKASEIVAVVRDVAGDRIVLLERPPEVPEVDETGDTLEENAFLKAFSLGEATGMPAIADDTGLEVRALGGAPGVRSSRYSGEHASYAENVAKLLAELDRVGAMSPDDRKARFCTVALAVFPDGRRLVAEGSTEGTISLHAIGAGGFGYDPVFVPDDGDGRTFAQMSSAEKHAISHRGRAFRALAAGLIAPGGIA
ncbi:MAG: RdgB/HAM1 family non-canonical purine NTP pyrophosphatase [Acidimicrobiales bacterium]